MSQAQINRMVVIIILCVVILLAALGACVAGWWRGVVDPSARPAPTPTRPSISAPLFQGSEMIFGNGPQGLGGVLAPLAGAVLPQLNPVQLIGAMYWGVQDATRWIQTLVAVILFALGLFSEVFRPPRDLVY